MTAISGDSPIRFGPGRIELNDVIMIGKTDRSAMLVLKGTEATITNCLFFNLAPNLAPTGFWGRRKIRRLAYKLAAIRAGRNILRWA